MTYRILFYQTIQEEQEKKYQEQSIKIIRTINNFNKKYKDIPIRIALMGHKFENKIPINFFTLKYNNEDICYSNRFFYKEDDDFEKENPCFSKKNRQQCLREYAEIWEVCGNLDVKNNIEKCILEQNFL